MIAEAFITFGIANLLFIIGGTVFAILTVVAFVTFKSWSEGSDTAVLLPAMLAVLAIVMGVVVPHTRTQDALHGAQARADFRKDYGARIVKMSLTDHWAVAEVPGCSQQIRAEMRRVHGNYWFAYGVQKKDEAGQSYTDYQPIRLRGLLIMCGQVTTANNAVAIG